MTESDAGMLDEHNVLSIALGANWIYALPSSQGVLLIDAGPDYEGAWDVLAAQLHAAGLDVSDVRTVLITHAHIDHCGLARRWQQTGAEVAASADEVDRFLLGDRVVRFQSDLVFRFFLEAGVPAQRLERFLRAQAAREERLTKGQTPTRERWPGFLRGAPFSPDRRLHDGDVVRLGERALTFLSAPGHTPGNAVYLEEASGCLFSGDQLLPRITPNPGIHFLADRSRFRSLPAYTRSLQRIAAHRPRHLYPGHGGPNEDAPAAIARTLDHHAKRQGRVLRFLRDGPLTPYELLCKFFPHLPDGRLWQAMAEVVGHIDALAERGDIVEEEGAGNAAYCVSRR